MDEGIIEAARAMGASPFEIIRRCLIPEAFPSLILSITTATIGLDWCDCNGWGNRWRWTW